MKRYEVDQVSAMVGCLGDHVKAREQNGWTLVPPILLQPNVFTNHTYPSLLYEGYYTLTFEKECD
ncbi:MAG: hypothetical protein Q4D02_05820 [Clostridia bacterium]|nr:hypothetical protein [Clostridia bacterium]